MENNSEFHIPVMGAEVIHYLLEKRDGNFVDGTCGTGGHTQLILKNLDRRAHLVACDLDPDMLAVAERRNREVNEAVRFLNCSFHKVAELLRDEEKPLDGFVLDLGLNSIRLDSSHGFGFKTDTPLDMRFSPDNPVTAADIINGYSRTELKRIFNIFGELKQAGPLADRIVSIRKSVRIETTFQLRDAIQSLFPSNRLNKCLAQTAQAIRIEVNNELEIIKQGLRSLTSQLAKEGRLVVISYHSLEDRIVKNFIRSASRESGYPPDLEEVLDRREFRLRPLTDGAVVPSNQEINANPRARSAKLRAAARV